MLNHSDIWAAIDRLAQDKGMSPSGLARCAGLDPTTFNRSKRITREGKPRWPSTESISKILTATDTSVDRFLGILNNHDQRGNGRTTLPMASFSKLKIARHPSDGKLRTDKSWDEIAAPEIADPHAFAVEINGATFEPIFRDGDIVIVSPAASIRRGDRVLLITTLGTRHIGVLRRQTTSRIDLASLDCSSERSFTLVEVQFLGRLLWASQ